MAGECVAARRNEHQLASPAAHAGLRKCRVIVRHNIFGAELAAEAFLRLLQEFDGLEDLLASGQELIAVGEGPAVILHVRKFDASGGGGFGEGEHFRKLEEIGAMNDEVESDGGAARLEPFEETEFVFVRLSAGDFGRDFRASALKTELQVVEAGGEERIEAGFVQGQAGSDEVDIETSGASGFDELDQIGAGERLAAREVELEHAGFGGFAEDAGPFSGGEFLRTGDEFDGIRTIDAMQWAAVGKFGDKGEWMRHWRQGPCAKTAEVLRRSAGALRPAQPAAGRLRMTYFRNLGEIKSVLRVEKLEIAEDILFHFFGFGL